MWDWPSTMSVRAYTTSFATALPYRPCGSGRFDLENTKTPNPGVSGLSVF